METILFSEESVQQAVMDSFDPVFYRVEQDQNNVINVYDNVTCEPSPLMCVTIKYVPYCIYLDYRAYDSNDLILTKKLNQADKMLMVHRRHKEYNIQHSTPEQVVGNWNAMVDNLCNDIEKIQNALQLTVTYEELLRDAVIRTRNFVDRCKNDPSLGSSDTARTVDLDYEVFTGKQNWNASDVINLIRSDPLMFLEMNSGLSRSPFDRESIYTLIQNFAKECIGG